MAERDKHTGGQPRGRPRGSLGRFAQTLLTVLVEQFSEIGVVLPPLASERLMAQWCFDLIHGNLETAYDRRFKYAIGQLHKFGLIGTHGGKVVLAIEPRIQWRHYQLDQMRLVRPKRWDGHWRIVVWDVPERRRLARDRLRQSLRQLGFAQIQRSVWVVPWPCHDEIEFLRDEYKLGPSLLYLESRTIDGAIHLRDRFGLN